MNDRKRRLNALARRLASRLPGPVKSVLRQPVTRPATADQSALAPLLSVVVVASNAETCLRQCLDSLQSQSLKRLEVLVVDDGSTDATARVAQEVAAKDARFHVLVRPRLGSGASRNAGAQLARGRFLAFLDATDTVPRHAYAQMVGSLRRTGSDFAAGSVRTVVRDRIRRPPWATLTHDRDRPAQTLSEFPVAFQDISPTNRVFRRTFWNTSVGSFPDSAGGETFAIAIATLQARKFDFLQTISCIQHTQHVPGTLLPAPMSASELHSRLNWHRRTWRLVRDSVDARIAGPMLGRLIDGDLGDFAPDAHRADNGYSEQLQEAARECLAMADDTVWPHVRVERKVGLWLVANGRWSDLELLTHHFAIYGSMPRTEVRDGRVYAATEQLPGITGIPPEYLELGEGQTAFAGCIERLAWDGDNLEVHGWAFIQGLDLATHPPQLTAWLTEPVTGFSHRCEIRQLHKAAANQLSRLRYQDVAAGGFIASIDTTRIDSTPGRWQLRLTVRAAGLERTASIHAVAPGGLRRLMSPRNLKQPDEQNRVVPKLDSELGFGIHVRPERIQASWLATDGAGKASGALRLVDSRLGALVSVTAIGPRGCVAGDLSEADADGLQHFELDLPANARAAADWEFRAVDVNHHEHRVCWPAETDFGRQFGGGLGDACWRRSTTGYCDLTTDWAVAEAEHVTISAAELSIDLRLTGLGVSDCTGAKLSGSLVDVPVRDLEPVGDGVRLVFPLRATRWRAPELPLPSGDYRILLRSGDRVLCSEELINLLPDEGLAAHHSYRVGRDGPAELLISLAAPLTDEERSRVAQHQLGTWYQESAFTPTESILFQSYRGEFATDSQLALHSELRNQRPDLELLWGVRDLSVAVPDGGRPLLIESREWYAALASSRYLCQNIEFERYFRKRPHQRYLQTFHGYPFKSMGESLWRAQGRPESVITSECARRGGAWDAIVVPETLCVDLYRREYRYTGEILATGYPRNDALLREDAAAARARVLEQLGIGTDRIIVLYAPTWRDTVATSPWTAKLFDGLDVQALAAQLGDDYAVLLRGHNYNLREGLTPITGHVWDVSAYPEINDLLLAADVAVLDYSSIRFDWLVTGKPVLFFVPDLVDYLSSRGVLFDYESTAPGPLLESTAEVAATLLDLGGVASEYAAARELFNKQFNRLHDGYATERVINAFF